MPLPLAMMGPAVIAGSKMIGLKIAATTCAPHIMAAGGPKLCAVASGAAAPATKAGVAKFIVGVAALKIALACAAIRYIDKKKGDPS